MHDIKNEKKNQAKTQYKQYDLTLDKNHITDIEK